MRAKSGWSDLSDSSVEVDAYEIMERFCACATLLTEVDTEL